ncbi:MAG: GtrA family protein [Candidatus Moraniibacteriota bacterium]|nr:MAG: GtrA family protein [Candidatus Moranbacteria bacterium]
MQKNTSPLSLKDLIFGGINGGIFGLMAVFTLKNFNSPLTENPLLILIGFTLFSVLGIAIGYLLSRYIANFFFQLAKFGAVGAANFSIDFGVLNLLILVSHISNGIGFTGFKAISFVVAVINSYFWNKFWSFESKNTKKMENEFSQFLMVSFIGALLNVGISHLMVNVIGSGTMNSIVWANISAAIASIAVISWNFFGYKFFVFKK